MMKLFMLAIVATTVLLMVQKCDAMSLIKLPSSALIKSSSDHHDVLAAMLPGDPMVTGVFSQGVINGISIYSNVILARLVTSSDNSISTATGDNLNLM